MVELFGGEREASCSVEDGLKAKLLLFGDANEDRAAVVDPADYKGLDQGPQGTERERTAQATDLAKTSKTGPDNGGNVRL